MTRIAALPARNEVAAIRLLLASELLVQPERGAASPLIGKDGALLAWLAIEGPTSRERMARLLWPESDDEAARNALRQRIFKLRKVAGGEIVVGRTTLALAAGIAHDLDGSAHLLGKADARLTGELAGWLDQQRQQRHLGARQLLIDRILAAEARGDPSAALPFAHELLSLDMLSEDAHRRLIRLHYAAGDRPLAMRAFERCESMLRSELGVTPSDETVALMKVVEGSEAATRADRAAVAAPFGSLPASVLRPPRRIGREAVWAALARAVAERRVVLISGEAGLGKSRLLGDFGEASGAARPSTLVVTARPGDRAVPYAVWTRGVHQLVTTYALTPDSAAERELARLLPERRERLPVRREDDAARLADALRAQVSKAAARGLVALAVDDLQFADDASVRLLQMLVADRTLAWLIAFRPAELSGAALAMIDALEASADVESVRLSPFDGEQTRELLASLDVPGLDRFGDGGSDEAASLHRRTGGNPMYVLETLKTALMPPRIDGVAATPSTSPRPWPTAPNVNRLIEQRLLRLTPLALSVARCAGVAGPDASPPLIAATLGVRPLDLADAWTELERAGVFTGGRFAHDLIAEAALATVPEVIGQSLHGDVAAWLERESGEPAHIADHWIAAQQPRRAARHMVAAGAIARGALQLLQATDLYEAASRILHDAGDRRGAFDALLSAAEAYSETTFDPRLVTFRDDLRSLADDDAQRAWIELLDVALLVEAKRLTEAEHLARAAMVRARAADVLEVEAELLWSLTVVHWERRQTAEALAAAKKALALLVAVPPETLRFGAYATQGKLNHALGLLLSSSGSFEEGARYLAEARAIARRRDDRDQEGLIASLLASSAMDRGDLQGALAHMAGVVIATGQTFRTHPAVVSGLQRARLDTTNARLGAALAFYEEIAPWCAASTSRASVAPMVHRARLHRLLGRSDLARSALRLLKTQAGLLDIERVLIDAVDISLGPGRCPEELAERCSRIDSFSTRVDLLCLALARAGPDRALPLLATDQAAAGEFGAHGLWLKLQVTRVAVLSRDGRSPEAAEAALAACLRIDEGVVCAEPLPQLAAVLCPALAANEKPRARRLAGQAHAWMEAAAADLPDPWRHNFLQRAPALEGFRAFL